MPDENGNLTQEEMEAHARAYILAHGEEMDKHKAEYFTREAEKRKAAELASPTHFRNQLSLAQAAYQRAKDIGLNYAPPSQSLVDAAHNEAANELKAQTPAAPLAAQPDVTPGSELADARDILNPLSPNDQTDLNVQDALRMGISGPSTEAMKAAQSQFDAAGQGIEADQAALNQSLAQQHRATAEANQSAETQLNTQIAQNAELAPTAAKRTQIESDYELAQKQAYQAANEETNQQMARVRQSADEAANAQVKDFWADKSTAGKIIGIISQAFAGAANGLSGQPGAPTPLDRIIDRDIELQKINLNNKVTTSYREQGILGLLEKKFETQQAALGAAKLASIAHVDALAKEIAQKYNTPTAIAQYQQFHAQNLQKDADITAKVRTVSLNTNLQKQQIASGILERGISANAAASLAADKKTQGMHVIGLKEPLPATQYHQLAPFADSLAVELHANEKILELLKKPDLANANWRQQLENYASDTFAARRIDQKTGARLEGEEAKRIEVGVPSVKKDILGNITPRALYDFQKEVENNIQHDVTLYARRAQAVTGYTPDLNDPIIGRHLRRYATPAK